MGFGGWGGRWVLFFHLFVVWVFFFVVLLLFGFGVGRVGGWFEFCLWVYSA